MQINAQQFEKISIRGCVAYGICCLENALEHYNLHGEGWNFLLKKLWWYTELSAALDSTINCLPLERWAYLNTNIEPGKLESFANYDEFSKAKNWWFIEDMPTIKEYSMLKETYEGCNHVINLICKHLHQVGVSDLWAGIGNTSPNTLIPLQELINLMYEQQIPLPSIEPFKQYVFHKPGWDYDLHAFGEMFDGTQYSKFVKNAK